jgi:hypothetical protein
MDDYLISFELYTIGPRKFEFTQQRLYKDLTGLFILKSIIFSCEATLCMPQLFSSVQSAGDHCCN